MIIVLNKIKQKMGFILDFIVFRIFKVELKKVKNEYYDEAKEEDIKN